MTAYKDKLERDELNSKIRDNEGDMEGMVMNECKTMIVRMASREQSWRDLGFGTNWTWP